ncbi:MAG: DUF2344 domain-containing protein [Lachnospiraceae bacterium]|nr:DUF2344 domain-containing protein [Lachnospiraceae bacterium]
MNIRIKFQKYGSMKFIGHLDMMRYFQKAIRRADIDIAYSEGYSPHQIMSFAAPLGVGVTSDGEYFDIEAKTSRSSAESIQALNEVMAEGITVLEYKRLPDTAKTSMSLVAAADYLAFAKPGYAPLAETLEELQAKVQVFYESQEKICITKQTKKREIEMDLKPFIYQMEALNLHSAEALTAYGVKNPQILARGSETTSSCAPALFLKVCTGSSDNIKPELALEAFCRFQGIPYEAFSFQIHRLEVYAKADEIPVKGEHERKSYQAYLDKQRKAYEKKGEAFPQFLTLGELGRDV